MFYSLRRYVYFLSIVVSLFACEQKKNTQHTHSPIAKYGIIIFAGEDEDEEYFLPTNTLSEGYLKIPEKSEKIYSLISAYKHGYYFGIDDGKPKFTRYKPTPNGLETDVEIPFHHVPWKAFESWYNWIDDKTILLGSTMEGRQLVYSIIDTDAMKIVKYGNLDIPKPAKGEYYGGVMGQFRDNKLYVAYTEHTGWQNKDFGNDTTYLAIIDYPGMTTKQISTDTRSLWPGGLYLHAPYSFIDNGDIYFLSSPGGRTHLHATSPTGIYRIKKGQDILDPDYFFTLTDNKIDESYLLYYLGNGKALTKQVNKKKISAYMSYLERGTSDYYVLDLYQQTKTKLNIPPDYLSFTENVLVENGKAYIGVYNKENESQIWEYDIQTEKLKEGLKVEGRLLIITPL